MTDLTTQTPAQIDTALAEIYGRLYKVQDEIARTSAYIEDMEEGIAKAAEFAGTPQALRYSSYTQDALDSLLDKREGLRSQADDIRIEMLPYNQEFTRRGGWSRFFLVQNNGGHIHSSMSCSTCFPTTQFGWLPEFSGQTEAEAVAKHGAILCTVCYPSAPVEWTNGTKPGDEDTCTGSGRYYDTSKPSRTGYYTGNGGHCQVCGEYQTITSTGKIRKHKSPIAVAAAKAASGAIEVDGYSEWSSTTSTQTKTFKTTRGATNALASDLGNLVVWGTDHPSSARWLANVEAIRKALDAAGAEYDYDKALANQRKKVAEPKY